MGEIERLRAFAASCIAAARRMSLATDAARLREMAAEALKTAENLNALSPQKQQQQQPQEPPSQEGPKQKDSD
jgi:hypothetical protein